MPKQILTPKQIALQRARAKKYRERHPSKIAAKTHSYYIHNKEKRLAYAARRRARNRRIIDEIRSQGCNFCGEKELCLLDFHHRDPAQKLYNISQMTHRKVATLLAELAKCEVICCRCHKLHHFTDKSPFTTNVRATARPRGRRIASVDAAACPLFDAAYADRANPG